MKPFDCDICKKKTRSIDALVRWHFEKDKKTASSFQIVCDKTPCSLKGREDFFNRSLKLEYVFSNMPEFIYYIKRLKVNEKELKNFVGRIEKDRSYIRRFNIEKKEVKKLIIRLEGAQGEG
ncbi:MAG: hypothetical protein ABSA34_00185 [Candidatus Goldiibacteriota bacterium]|jgi:hypothetical protein